MSSDRALSAFLSDAPLQVTGRVALDADASARRYERLTVGGGGTAILMDARADPGLLQRFLSIGDRLADAGVVVPRALRTDPGLGLGLFDDFGDGLLARRIEDDPDRETGLYLRAVDTLIALQAVPLRSGDTLFFSAEHRATAAAALGWYPGLTTAARDAILDALSDCLATTDSAGRVFCHRDYHAENLVEIDAGPLGVLDFQDAVGGHPLYDLAALLADARRTVSPGTREAAMRHYLDRTGRGAEAAGRDAAVLSAQRNLRILTQFARLARRDGKPGYLPLMPRVWRNLQGDLRHPALSGLKGLVADHVRPPTPDLIAEVMAECRDPASH